MTTYSVSVAVGIPGGTSAGDGVNVCVAGGVLVGMVFREVAGWVSLGLFGGSLTGYCFSSNSSPSREKTNTVAVSNFSGDLGARADSLMVLK